MAEIAPRYLSLIEALISEVPATFPRPHPTPTETACQQLEPSEQVALVLAILDWYQQQPKDSYYYHQWFVVDVMVKLLRRSPSYARAFSTIIQLPPLTFNKDVHYNNYNHLLNSNAYKKYGSAIKS